MGITTRQFGPSAKGDRLTQSEFDENFNFLETDKQPHVQSVIGTVIDFTDAKIFNLPSNPGTGNITHNLADARIGIVQKIYHNSSSAPSLPGSWVAVGSGTYTTSTLNIIYAEWVSGTRVEYWITK